METLFDAMLLPNCDRGIDVCTPVSRGYEDVWQSECGTQGARCWRQPNEEGPAVAVIMWCGKVIRHGRSGGVYGSQNGEGPHARSRGLPETTNDTPDELDHPGYNKSRLLPLCHTSATRINVCLLSHCLYDIAFDTSTDEEFTAATAVHDRCSRSPILYPPIVDADLDSGTGRRDGQDPEGNPVQRG